MSYSLTIVHPDGNPDEEGIKVHLLAENFDQIKDFLELTINVDRYGILPHYTLAVLQDTARKNEYQDNEISLIKLDKRKEDGTPIYTGYIACIEGPHDPTPTEPDTFLPTGQTLGTWKNDA